MATAASRISLGVAGQEPVGLPDRKSPRSSSYPIRKTGAQVSGAIFCCRKCSFFGPALLAWDTGRNRLREWRLR